MEKVSQNRDVEQTARRRRATRWNRQVRFWWAYFLLAITGGGLIAYFGDWNIVHYLFLIGPFFLALRAGFLLNDRLRYQGRRPGMFAHGWSDAIRGDRAAEDWPYRPEE